MSRFNMQTPVSELSGIGKVRATQLAKLGISTLGDLIYFFPRAYEKRGDVRPLSACDTDTNCAYLLTVATEVRSTTIKRGLSISKFRAFDETGSIEIIFFNAPYIKDIFHIGSVFRFWGKIQIQKGRIQLTNPKYDPYIDGIQLADYVPIYPLTSGLSTKQLDKLVKAAINDVLPQIKDPLPDNIRIDNSLPTLSYAIKNAHFPENDKALSASLSRLAFDEMLYFGIGIAMSAKKKDRGNGIPFSPCSLKPFTDILPYELTDSQKSAINDIYRDTVLGKNNKISPMSRIIIGDVGCGKTVCALAAMYITVRSGFQAALMVPTEILANQHFEEATKLLSPLGLKVELLIGSTTQAQKKRIKEMLKSNEIDIIIGTHALISDNVDFANLGLVITDEQHRFGVGQRARLKEKSKSAHLLVMSATPIPRTLALAMYGDLDISKITDMPKGRQRVDTFVVNEEYRHRLNDFISKQVKLGGQCYIVCPAVESNEECDEPFICDYETGEIISENALNLKSVVDFSEKIAESLPNLSVAYLHGKMKSKEKDEIMEGFSKGDIHVLVSTTVIEVGVNVPNASLMIVENAERFGLSQLHQLRGRVGRGKRKSYCILVSDINSPKSKERLEIMRTTYNGFEIAEKDLLLRGPGDFFSSISGDNLRQSGGFNLKFSSMCNNPNLFNVAFSTAKAIIEIDPDLSLPEHKSIKEEIDKILNISSSIIS